VDDLPDCKIFETGQLMDELSVREKMDVCVLHMDRLIALKNENVAVRISIWYLKVLKGMP
jgi:hypothetical protein